MMGHGVTASKQVGGNVSLGLQERRVEWRGCLLAGVSVTSPAPVSATLMIYHA